MTRAAIAKRVVPLVLVAAAGVGIGWGSHPSHPLHSSYPEAPPASALATPSEVDIGFCQDMAVHHAQAVLMAQQALAISTTPAVRAVATQILVDQSQERGMLSGWLTVWHAPQLPSGPPMTWMHHDQSHADHPTPGDMPGMATPPASMPGTANPAGGMPGMATQAELDALGNARGPAFDTLFLKLMIRHHSGGILMADDARGRAALPEVRAAAGSMVIAQNEENAVMLRLLPPR